VQVTTTQLTTVQVPPMSPGGCPHGSPFKWTVWRPICRYSNGQLERPIYIAAIMEVYRGTYIYIYIYIPILMGMHICMWACMVMHIFRYSK
jgi:hypothetical protein